MAPVLSCEIGEGSLGNKSGLRPETQIGRGLQKDTGVGKRIGGKKSQVPVCECLESSRDCAFLPRVLQSSV